MSSRASGRGEQAGLLSSTCRPQLKLTLNSSVWSPMVRSSFTLPRLGFHCSLRGALSERYLAPYVASIADTWQ